MGKFSNKRRNHKRNKSMKKGGDGDSVKTTADATATPKTPSMVDSITNSIGSMFSSKDTDKSKTPTEPSLSGETPSETVSTKFGSEERANESASFVNSVDNGSPLSTAESVKNNNSTETNNSPEKSIPPSVSSKLSKEDIVVSVTSENKDDVILVYENVNINSLPSVLPKPKIFTGKFNSDGFKDESITGGNSLKNMLSKLKLNKGKKYSKTRKNKRR